MTNDYYRRSSDPHPTARRVVPPIVGVLVALVVVFSLTVAVAAAADLDPVAVEARAAAVDTTSPVEFTGEPDGPLLPDLPVPDPVPEDAYEDVPIVPIGSIEIPAIGLSHTMYSGVWLTVLDHGPGHWPGSAEPGGYGNSVIAGHRVTNSHPFRDLDKLNPGDEIIVNDDAGSHVYAVTGTEIVEPSAIRIIEQRHERTVTLFACHPPGSAAQRIVVYGDLVRSDGAPPAV